jgi:hypothetical protein
LSAPPKHTTACAARLKPSSPRSCATRWRASTCFGFVYQRRYELACTGCEHGWVLDTESMDQQLGGVPIPWRHRFGLPVMLVVVAGLAVAGWMWRQGHGG